MSDALAPGAILSLHLRRELVDRGWTDQAIRAQLRSGTWTRVRPGAYADTTPWRALGTSDRHLVLSRAVHDHARTASVLSHASALVAHGAPTWGLDLGTVHVTRRDGKCGRREAGVRQHRGRLLGGDVVERQGLPVTSPTRAALEVTTVATSEAALVAVNHLLHEGLTTIDLLRDRFAHHMDRWPFTLTTDLVLRRATRKCESVAESRFMHHCYACGLPIPVPQFVVRGADGRELYRLDFAWPELGVFAEVDGRSKYVDPWRVGETVADVVLREKEREDEVRELTGWLCVRITWADLAAPEKLAARLRVAFARGAALKGKS
jgi:hypothetical protein